MSLQLIFQKITKENAWNLRLIDSMCTMLRNNDARMNDPQIASSVIDASAKIYSLRVDAVYCDALKMTRGRGIGEVIFSQEMLKT